MKSVLLILLLAGCATNSAAPSFSQVLATAEAADDAVVVAGTTALKAGTISSAQAQKVLTITDNVNAALSIANTTYQSGNATTANAQLAAATAILTLVQSCLATSKATFDTCLTPPVSK